MVQELDLRFAAAVTIRGFVRIIFDCPQSWQHIAQQTLDVMFAIYDALNDDDEELRVIAAEAASLLLSISGKKIFVRQPVPLVAQQMIVTRLLTLHFGSSLFAREAILRLSGGDLRQTVKQQLNDALANNSTLFVVERQNLYIDDVREAHLWSRAMKRVNPRNISADVLEAFVQWAVQGYHALMSRTTEITDGPLGWTSKPEVFTIGMRIIYAFEVLLHWRVNGSRRPNIRASQLHNWLREWADVGHEQNLHPLWLAQIEQVLTESLQLKVARIRQVMHTVLTRCT